MSWFWPLIIWCYHVALPPCVSICLLFFKLSFHNLSWYSFLCTRLSCPLFHWRNPNSSSFCYLPSILLPKKNMTGEKHKIVVKVMTINPRWRHTVVIVTKICIITKVWYPGIKMGLLPGGGESLLIWQHSFSSDIKMLMRIHYISSHF